MVKAIEQIRRDLNLVSERVITVQQALEQVYGDYLNALGDSLKRQLVLAGYQLCTQIYPQLFLQLSYNQRQTLQQELRRIGEEGYRQLQEVLTAVEPEEAETTAEMESSVSKESSLEQELLNVFESIEQVVYGEEAEAAANSHSAPDEDDPEVEQRRQELSQLAEHIAESIAEMMHSSPEEEMMIEEGSPAQLVAWCKTREKLMRSVLDQVSQQANRLLQKVRILPEHIPAPVLDMAIQADNQHNSGQAPNNLVRLTIEADLGKKKKQRTRLTAVHFKVSELEFTDARVSAQRNRIREQLLKVKQLTKYYAKSRQDLAIAEAEAAWRSSWHEGELKG